MVAGGLSEWVVAALTPRKPVAAKSAPNDHRRAGFPAERMVLKKTVHDCCHLDFQLKVREGQLHITPGR